MQSLVGYVAVGALLASAGGFLLSLLTSGAAGFVNRLGFSVGMVGLIVLVVALVVGLALEVAARIGRSRDRDRLGGQ